MLTHALDINKKFDGDLIRGYEKSANQVCGTKTELDFKM